MPEGISLGSGWSGAVWVLLGSPPLGAWAQRDKAASSHLWDREEGLTHGFPAVQKNTEFFSPEVGLRDGREEGELCLLPLWLPRDSKVLGANGKSSTSQPLPIPPYQPAAATRFLFCDSGASISVCFATVSRSYFFFCQRMALWIKVFFSPP